MNDEIKEILDYLKEFIDEDRLEQINLNRWFVSSLLDYITNLQQENERLKKRNKEIYDGFIATQEELSDYAKENDKLRVKLSKCTRKHWQSKCAEHFINEKLLQSRIEKAINKVQYIIDIGFDYDGYNDVDNLKILVDELVDLARQTKNILRGKDNE